ncbi:hypothetical protein Tsubulata_018419, partial [Turnera subulata]
DHQSHGNAFPIFCSKHQFCSGVLHVLHFLIGFLLLKNLMVYPVTERSKTSSQWMAHHSSKDAGLVNAIARQSPRCLTETFNTQTMERKEQMYN